MKRFTRKSVKEQEINLVIHTRRSEKQNGISVQLPTNDNVSIL